MVPKTSINFPLETSFQPSALKMLKYFGNSKEATQIMKRGKSNWLTYN